MGCSGESVVAILEQHARDRAQSTAYRFLPDRGEAQALTFSELRQGAAAMASFLRDNTLEGARVLILEPTGLDFFTSFFGVLGAGRAAVPLSPPRSARSAERYAQVLALAQPQLVVGPRSVRDRLTDRPGWSELPWLHPADLVETSPEHGLWAPKSSDLALVQFTSGSTGNPKGVRIEHRHLMHNLEQMRTAMALSEGSSEVTWLPLQHDMGLIGGGIAPLFMGRPCTVMAPETFVMRPVRWLQALTETRATVSGGPDFAYALCADRVKADDLEGLDLSSWEVAFTGAEPVRASTIERFSARFASVGFRREAFFPCYGLAEATLLVASAGVEDPPRAVLFDADGLASGRLEVGGGKRSRALIGHGGSHLGQEIAIVDPEQRRRCPEGVIGEIWVRGESVGAGYLSDPEATEVTFGAELLDQPGVRWLRTGDLGGVHAGQLFITGRRKDLIIVNGRNLYPQDLEKVVEGSSPSVASAIAFSVDDGDEERLVVAVELTRVARTAPIEAVEASVRAALFTSDGVTPFDVVVVAPGRLPRTTSGKPRRQACCADYLSGRLPRVPAPG